MFLPLAMLALALLPAPQAKPKPRAAAPAPPSPLLYRCSFTGTITTSALGRRTKVDQEEGFRFYRFQDGRAEVYSSKERRWFATATPIRLTMDRTAVHALFAYYESYGSDEDGEVPVLTDWSIDIDRETGRLLYSSVSSALRPETGLVKAGSMSSVAESRLPRDAELRADHLQFVEMRTGRCTPASAPPVDDGTAPGSGGTPDSDTAPRDDVTEGTHDWRRIGETGKAPDRRMHFIDAKSIRRAGGNRQFTRLTLLETPVQDHDQLIDVTLAKCDDKRGGLKVIEERGYLRRKPMTQDTAPDAKFEKQDRRTLGALMLSIVCGKEQPSARHEIDPYAAARAQWGLED